MTEAVSRIYEEARVLSNAKRGELIDLMLEQINEGAPEVGPADLAELRRRIDEVDRGEVELIPSEEVEAAIREVLESARGRA